MRKIVCCLLAAAMLLLFSACTEEVRPGYEQLSSRLAAVNERYAFDYFDLFLYEGTYHTYFSLCSEDDAMLSFQLDDNGNIDNLTVTAYADSMKTEEERSAFADFACAVLDAFADQLTEKESAEIEKSLSFQQPKLYFSDLYETYSALRYRFIFSSNEQFISLYCEYYEVMAETSP